jgi:hypothetical protein
MSGYTSHSVSNNSRFISLWNLGSPDQNERRKLEQKARAMGRYDKIPDRGPLISQIRRRIGQPLSPKTRARNAIFHEGR